MASERALQLFDGMRELRRKRIEYPQARLLEAVETWRYCQGHDRFCYIAVDANDEAKFRHAHKDWDIKISRIKV